MRASGCTRASARYYIRLLSEWRHGGGMAVAWRRHGCPGTPTAADPPDGLRRVLPADRTRRHGLPTLQHRGTCSPMERQHRGNTCAARVRARVGDGLTPDPAARCNIVLRRCKLLNVVKCLCAALPGSSGLRTLAAGRSPHGGEAVNNESK